ncbi:MAG: hypothetical protein M1825_004179 [Sarcosagium campestre]|nr:MAG: hypothetical protein M1825_004179 [Sarcosagium campestre]
MFSSNDEAPNPFSSVPQRNMAAVSSDHNAENDYARRRRLAEIWANPRLSGQGFASSSLNQASNSSIADSRRPATNGAVPYSYNSTNAHPPPIARPSATRTQAVQDVALGHHMSGAVWSSSLPVTPASPARGDLSSPSRASLSDGLDTRFEASGRTNAGFEFRDFQAALNRDSTALDADGESDCDADGESDCDADGESDCTAASTTPQVSGSSSSQASPNVRASGAAQPAAPPTSTVATSPSHPSASYAAVAATAARRSAAASVDMPPPAPAWSAVSGAVRPARGSSFTPLPAVVTASPPTVASPTVVSRRRLNAQAQNFEAPNPSLLLNYQHQTNQLYFPQSQPQQYQSRSLPEHSLSESQSLYHHQQGQLQRTQSQSQPQIQPEALLREQLLAIQRQQQQVQQQLTQLQQQSSSLLAPQPQPQPQLRRYQTLPQAQRRQNSPIAIPRPPPAVPGVTDDQNLTPAQLQQNYEQLLWAVKEHKAAAWLRTNRGYPPTAAPAPARLPPNRTQSMPTAPTPRTPVTSSSMHSYAPTGPACHRNQAYNSIAYGSGHVPALQTVPNEALELAYQPSPVNRAVVNLPLPGRSSPDHGFETDDEFYPHNV